MDPNNQTPPPLPPVSPAAPTGQPAAPQSQPYPFRPGSTPIAQQPASQSSQPPKQQIIERLKEANNVLVTVSNNPSVDQLSACIGLTLILNKLGKHATAVFSGAVPSTIEFLQPEKTIEKNTDSLRDFIIALDKSKADKLRYKVEDKFVKIFITPYKTSLSEKDLEFSEGDFNVEVVIALGVHHREELDQAITAHGRILHDATVISINDRNSSDLGVINWNESSASSLCELLVSLGETLRPGVIDAQMATAFLTGIVAETERFSNSKTSAVTMGIASQLMRAGANQQLIANKLEEPAPVVETKPEAEDKNEEVKPSETPKKPPEPPKKDEGALQIPHDDRPVPLPPAAPAEDEGEESVSKIQIDDEGELRSESEATSNTLTPATGTSTDNSPKIVLNPPSMGGTLTANTSPEDLEPSIDPLSTPSTDAPILDRPSSTPSSLPSSDFGSNTSAAPSNVDRARQEVNTAEQKNTDERLGPTAALGSKPLESTNGDLYNNAQTPTAPPVPPPFTPPTAPPTT
jgi:hypothetical protein